MTTKQQKEKALAAEKAKASPAERPQFDRSTLPPDVHTQKGAPNTPGPNGMLQPNAKNTNPNDILGIDKLRAGNPVPDVGAALLNDNARDYAKNAVTPTKKAAAGSEKKATPAAEKEPAKAKDEDAGKKEGEDNGDDTKAE